MISNSGTSTLGLYDFKRQIDAFGGVDYFRQNLVGGYLKNARVMLTNGDIVKSTVDGNTSDPNNNMATWDQPYNVYDFKTEQPIQWYFNKYENWDDALFHAQLNVYLKDFSPTLRLPNGEINFYKPILGGATLGLKIDKYLRDNGIESDFYNPETKRFKKIWSFILLGQGSNKTVLKSRVCSNRSDRNFANTAAIWCGQDVTDPNFLIGGDTLPYWQNFVHISGFSLYARFNNVPSDPEQGYAWTHGIYLGGADQVATTKFKISDLVVDGFVGSGICLDNAYDCRVEQITLLRCGRMAGNSWDYGFNNNLSVRKQLFAPLHIMCSSGDNSNFIRLYDLHFELNVASCADLIVSGNSSPVWLKNFHFECGAWGGGYSAISKKVRMAVGDYGAKSILSEDYNASNNSVYSTGGGYVSATDLTGYNEGYEYGLICGTYSEFSAIQETVPNGLGNVLVESANTPCSLSLTNYNVGDINMVGNASLKPLTLTNVQSGNITLSYTFPPVLNNVKCNGDLSISNTYFTNPLNNCIILNDVSAVNLNGTTTARANGTLNLSGTINGFYAQLGDLKITSDSGYIAQMGV